MTIRKMTEADILQVAEIEQATFSRPWSAAAFADALHDRNALFLVAEESNLSGCKSEASTVAGYIGMYLSPPEGEITNVAVAETQRGRGYGGGLVRAMQQNARAFGVNVLFLEVRKSNEAAIHVYTAAGFEEIGLRKGFYEVPREDARIMKWVDDC